MKTLKQFVLEQLAQNSGGIKFLELMVVSIEAAHNKEIKGVNFHNKDYPGFLEKEIRKIPGVGILEYSMPLGKDPDDKEVWRSKMFVYLKPPGE